MIDRKSVGSVSNAGIIHDRERRVDGHEWKEVQSPI